MNPNIFREYDIRGIVGKDFKLEETSNLAKAIFTYFIKHDPLLSKIIIGTDGRTHSPIIKKAAIEAATMMGLNVIDIGLCPTPLFYFSLFNTEATTGIVITASHNPKEYNGIKICLNQKMVWGDKIRAIYQIYQSQLFAQSTIQGTVTQIDIITPYIDWMENNFPHLKNIAINAAIDSGNGAAGVVIPKLIERMGWENTTLLCQDVDGNFPNHEADPTNISNMNCVINALRNNPTLEFGLGLDGDADRMNPITKTELLIPGDELLALYSQQVIKNNPHAAVVFDIKSSLSLIEELKRLGAKACIAPSGHSYIKEAMLNNNALLAGELSCHFFFKDKYFGYDDGIYAMIRLIEILQITKQPLEKLLESFPKKTSSKEFRISCPDEEKQSIINHVKQFFASKQCKEIITIDGIRAQMEYGWGLARASNTQPVISLRFESDNNQDLRKIKNDFIEALTPYFHNAELDELKS